MKTTIWKLKYGQKEGRRCGEKPYGLWGGHPGPGCLLSAASQFQIQNTPFPGVGWVDLCSLQCNDLTETSSYGASEYLAALSTNTANLVEGGWCASHWGYTWPCPLFPHMSSLSALLQNGLWIIIFFIPTGLVWNPHYWKNSQLDMWWDDISLALTIRENHEKIRAISSGEGKGVLYLLRASGEWADVKMACTALVWNAIWKRLRANLSLYRLMFSPHANLWMMKLLERGKSCFTVFAQGLVRQMKKVLQESFGPGCQSDVVRKGPSL